MVDVTLPDGTKKQVAAEISLLDFAGLLSKSLKKDAILAEIDGQLCELSTKIIRDADIRILTAQDPRCLEVIRHDAAHITAAAVMELFPDVKITIGPSIKNGFYYDFAKDSPFTESDLVMIEKKMREIVSRDEKFEHQLLSKDQAIEYFNSINQNYKVEIIKSIPISETISLYKNGNFVDLCRGPHGPSTGRIKHFKLMKVAGAYWRGDSKNAMLQRIYGTAFATEHELLEYLGHIEEAEKRDHRKLGKELDLFHFQEEAQAMPFWHHKGFNLYKILQSYIRKKLILSDYIEVNTPTIVENSLWKKSGHWDKFGDNMFKIEHGNKILGLKPMNCPCHVQIFNQKIRSYRDLPIRMAEFGTCYRNEHSGGLHGLFRVRSFVQDDAHIFCTEDQITEETIKFCALLKQVYNDLGFSTIKVKFSDRPDLRAGTDEIWDKAEQSLKNAMKEACIEYDMNPGEGAFYGPKVEFVLSDAMGRDWQCGTLQVDFVLPERLGAKYVANDGNYRVPVMLHRAILGAFERFIGILIEQHAGKFPLWLSPIQVGLASVDDEHISYAKSIYEKLVNAGIRCELETSSEKIGYKIRYFSKQKIPIIAVVGANEMRSGSVNLRFFGSSDLKSMSIDDLLGIVIEENGKYF